MHRNLPVTVCLALAWAVNAVAAPAFPATQANALLNNAITQQNLVGLTAAIAVNGEIVWRGAAGLADREKNVPVTPDMLHRIASISKPQTATAAMRLVEQGKLKLDAPITTYIPTYPVYNPPIQILHLLTHTSGIPHYYKPGQNRSNVHYDSLLAAVANFQNEHLRADPGSKYLYTTLGYTLLGAAIESASQKNFADAMHDLIWQPANMPNTRLEIAGQPTPPRMLGYTKSNSGEIAPTEPTDLSLKYPGGGMLSTPSDLLNFIIAFDNGTLVSDSTRARMLTPTALPDGRTVPYGIGWSVGESPDLGSHFGHNGNQAGASSDLRLYTKHHVAIALISNLEKSNEALDTLRDELVKLAITPEAAVK